MDELNDVQKALKALGDYLDKCKEYLIPYEKEDEIMELDKHYGVVNLSVNRLVEGKEVSLILKKYKIPHSIDYVESLKFVDVYIPKEAIVADHISHSSLYVINHAGSETTIII